MSRQVKQYQKIWEELGKDLDRIREMLSIRQADWAQEAQVSQGTISNFLRGRLIRADHRQRIIHALATAVKRDRMGILPEDKRTYVRNVMEKALVFADSSHPARARRIESPKWPSGEPSRLWEIVMGLCDEPRLNLAKSFDFYHLKHFEAHVACFANGVLYRWLAYETETLRSEWEAYLEELRRQLKGKQLGTIQRRLQRSVGEEDIRDLLDAQLECHIFPRSAQNLGQIIPFRITVFGNTVCLCGAEKAPGTYPRGLDLIVLEGPGLSAVKTALEVLFDHCPPIAPAETIVRNREIDNNLLQRMHSDLRASFLRAMAMQQPSALQLLA